MAIRAGRCAGENRLRGGARNKLIFLAIAVGLFSDTSAVDFPLRWRWSNPEPHGANVVDMAYSAQLAVSIQVAERGQIFTSSDLDLWQARESSTTNALRGTAFFGSRILIAGENGTVLYADTVDNFKPGTLLDGSTPNWLEAVTASPQLAVAAGDNGAIYTSTNGVTWKQQHSGSAAWFRGAAFGNGVFVVVGEDGAILTSPDGTNWTLRTSPTSEHLNRVGFGNGRFVAVGENGVTLSSTNDGAAWFFEYPGATNSLQYAVTAGPDWLLDGSHEVRLQDNQPWSDELARSNGPPNWTYYTAIGEPGFFLIAGQSGLQSEAYQEGDLPYWWLTPHDSVRNWLWDVFRLPSFYVTVGDYGTIMTSGNGVDWTLELTPLSATNSVLLGVGGTSELLVAVGSAGTVLVSPNILSNVVITNITGVVTQTVSSHGVLWYALPKFTSYDLQAVGVLDNSTYFIGGEHGSLYSSTNGTNWTPQTSGTANILTSIAEWPGGLVAVGDNGTLLTSVKGKQWKKIALNTTNWLYRVRYLHEVLMTVGQNGSIFTSTNGVDWVPRVSGTSAWLNDVAFVQDTWFVIGTGGTVLTSSDLVRWTYRGTITKKALYGAAAAEGQLVVVGVEGAILRSQIVPDLTPVSFLDFDRVTNQTPPSAVNLYLFGGKPDQRFTLDRTTNLVSSGWTAGPLLEIFDGAGTLYYIETLADTNLPPLEYYRARLAP